MRPFRLGHYLMIWYFDKRQLGAGYFMLQYEIIMQTEYLQTQPTFPKFFYFYFNVLRNNLKKNNMFFFIDWFLDHFYSFIYRYHEGWLNNNKIELLPDL